MGNSLTEANTPRSSAHDHLEKYDREALAYCHHIIEDVSRTFAIGIERAPEPLSTYICICYLLCRIPDTLEDAPHISLDRKSDLLDRYEHILKHPDPDSSSVTFFQEQIATFSRDNPNWDLSGNLPQVLRVLQSFPASIQQEAIPKILELTEGMRTMLVRHNGHICLQDMDEFHEYCYYVAGTVGQLLTVLFAHHEDLQQDTADQLFSHATEFGEALQTVNIVKDCYQDETVEDTVYLPKKRLQKYGSTANDPLAHPEATLNVLRDLMDHASRKLDVARTYIDTLPHEARDARTFCIVPYLLAGSTLQEARSRPKDLVTPTPVKVSRETVAQILDTIPKCIESNENLNNVEQQFFVGK